MAVTLQIVGLYYKFPLEIPIASQSKITVREVLDFAKTQHPSKSTFSYGVGQGTQSAYIDFFMVHFPNVFSSPVSGTLYFPGTFTLAQTFTKPVKESYTVWQYYVIDKTGAPVLPGKSKFQEPGKGTEVPFGQAKIVEDGFTVIWRLVEIFKAVPFKLPPIISLPNVNATQVPQPLPNGGPVMNARLAQVAGMPAEKAERSTPEGAPVEAVSGKSGS